MKAALVVVQCEHELAKIVFADGSSSRFADLLNCWKKHADQNANNGDDDQELNQGEAVSLNFEFIHNEEKQSE